MPNLTSYFLNSNSNVVLFETLEISHPSFSETYRVVRNNRFGIDVILETGSPAHFKYYPVRVKRNGTSSNLDQSFRFTVGDLGELVHNELDRLVSADTLLIKPACIYRSFRSDDLSAPVNGPFRLVISAIPVTDEGFAFDATPEQANDSTTGEIYTLERFAGLRGFL